MSATPPAGAYDEIFGETAGYDDGFAKIVHAAQQTTGMPIGLGRDSNQTAQGPATAASARHRHSAWLGRRAVADLDESAIADPHNETRQSQRSARATV